MRAAAGKGAAGPLAAGRGAFLAVLVAGAMLTGAVASGAPPPPSPPSPLILDALHTGESLAVAVAGSAGAAAVSHLLRDHRTGEEHAIDPALLTLLVAVAARCGCPPHFGVISGYRSPVTNAALRARSNGVSEHSLHMQGRAIDVRLEGCPLERLRDAGLALGGGGVGYYPGSRFVHLDTGRVRSWAG